MKVDAIVIGAGIAGLACASALTAAGVVTVVMEARDRIGGRILTLRFPDEAPVELGAQVVHGDRAATWSVIQEAGLRVAPVTSLGEIVFNVEGRIWTVADIQRVRAPLPWTIEQRLIRSQSTDHAAEEILHRYENRGLGRALALEWLAQTWCANPAELSVAGMKRVREAWNAGEGEFKVLDGYDRIPRELARNLDVRLQQPAQLICWQPGCVTIHAPDEMFEARAAVVTVPPSVIAAGSIRFDPPLPSEKMNAASAIGAGGALVLVTRLIKPSPRSLWALVVGQDGGFWRAEAGSTLVRGWMKGFASTRTDWQRLSGEQLIRLTGGVFPWIQASDVTAIYSVNWQRDPFARAGFSFPRVGGLDASFRWAAPLAHSLFFAGEATCGDRHLGMAHGAMESGQRAATEVIGALTY